MPKNKDNNNKNNNKKPSKIPKWSYVLIAIAAILFIATFFFAQNPDLSKYKASEVTNFGKIEAIADNVSFTEFKELLKEEKIETIYAEFEDAEYANIMFFKVKDSEGIYMVQNPNNDTFKRELLETGINIKNKVYVFELTDIQPSVDTSANTFNLFSTLISIGISVVFFYYIFTMLKKQGGFEDSGIGKIDKQDVKQENRADTEPKTFDEVGGLHALKQDLKTVVDFMKNQQNYVDAGAKLPRGVLLVGPPGTGKTLLARVIAKEAGVNFLYMAGSDFVEMYVGRGAARVRNLFKEARKQAPCIVFIDEIDTLCGKRGGERGEHSEDRKTLTALLAEMDGFKTTENILVIGATNRVDDIDAAALRPGRFTDIYNVPLPETTEERMEIIKIYMRGKKFAEDFDEKAFAREMMGRSPAEIEAVLNEAAIVSVKKGLGYINKDCIEEAFYKRVMQGHQKDNSETDPRDLKVIAYHEAGHALIARLTGSEVTKVTIAPSTSGAGGVTFIQPGDRKLYTKKMMRNKVMELYGGRAAEYLLADKNWDLTTSGASNDIEQATKWLKNMVDSFGMSDNGLVNMDLLSRETTEKSSEYIINLSKELIEATVKLMEEHRDLLEQLAAALLENETIYEEEVNRIMGDKVGIAE